MTTKGIKECRSDWVRVIDSFLHFNVLVCSLILILILFHFCYVKLQALDASAATIGQIVSLGVHSLSLTFFTQIKRQLKERKKKMKIICWLLVECLCVGAIKITENKELKINRENSRKKIKIKIKISKMRRRRRNMSSKLSINTLRDAFLTHFLAPATVDVQNESEQTF